MDLLFALFGILFISIRNVLDRAEDEACDIISKRHEDRHRKLREKYRVPDEIYNAIHNVYSKEYKELRAGIESNLDSVRSICDISKSEKEICELLICANAGGIRSLDYILSLGVGLYLDTMHGKMMIEAYHQAEILLRKSGHTDATIVFYHNKRDDWRGSSYGEIYMEETLINTGIHNYIRLW